MPQALSRLTALSALTSLAVHSDGTAAADLLPLAALLTDLQARVADERAGGCALARVAGVWAHVWRTCVLCCDVRAAVAVEWARVAGMRGEPLRSLPDSPPASSQSLAFKTSSTKLPPPPPLGPEPWSWRGFSRLTSLDLRAPVEALRPGLPCLAELPVRLLASRTSHSWLDRCGVDRCGRQPAAVAASAGVGAMWVYLHDVALRNPDYCADPARLPYIPHHPHMT